MTETVQTKVKEQKGRFLSMFSHTLVARLLGNLLIGREVNRAGKHKGRGINKTGEGVLRAGYGNKMDF